MALKGTLKDFGIAEILQLIGQQQKTGILRVSSRDEEVSVGFKDGSIVKAETSTRKKKDLIGAMLVRAELITEAQLALALETQKRTLKRLGDVLVGMQLLTEARFKQMVRLQTTETLYKLFNWKTGNYDFEQGEFEHEAGTFNPLSADAVLMEGMRRFDEWPMVRKRIPGYEVTFEVRSQLPPLKEGEEEESDGRSVGANERKVFTLVAPGRPARKIIDLSCLGEFNASKALATLVDLGHLSVKDGAGRSERLAADALRPGRLLQVTGGVLFSVLFVVGVVLGAKHLPFDSVRWVRTPSTSFVDPATERFISRHQMARIETALEIYRLEKGELPDALGALVETGLLSRDDLRHPWRDDYYYRKGTQGEFVLLPPLR